MSHLGFIVFLLPPSSKIKYSRMDVVTVKVMGILGIPLKA